MIVDGVELLRMIRDGELKENTKLVDDFGYEYFYEKDECEDLILYEFDNIVHKKIIPDYTMFQNNHFKILSEDEEIDIDSISEIELPNYEKWLIMDNKESYELNMKEYKLYNQLLKAVKQLNRKIKGE